VGEGQSAISPELSEEIDAQLEAAENELAAAGRTRHVEADLKVPNTLGPETHVYGTMAVHLYAKPQTN